jgi:hypothetical protein
MNPKAFMHFALTFDAMTKKGNHGECQAYAT